MTPRKLVPFSAAKPIQPPAEKYQFHRQPALPSPVSTMISRNDFEGRKGLIFHWMGL
jgi:hypothetical protein